MGIEIDLLKNYPKTKRNIKERGATKSEADRNLARKFGKSFLMAIERMGMVGLVTMQNIGSQ